MGWSGDLWTPARAESTRRSLGRAVNAPGTTLESTIRKPPAPPGTYVQLVEGPPYPIVVREELHPANPRPDPDRAAAIAAVVHLTDIHIIDAQSPTRVEFLDRLGGEFTSAQRPQETLTVHVATSMVERINEVAAGPVTGRPFDCAVSTGDNIDNQQYNELTSLLGVLDGGTVIPDSGARGRYEGVQDNQALYYDVNYWHPDPPPLGQSPDLFKATAGFPHFPGMLGAAVGPVTSPGLDIPWYCVFGNHDGLAQGTGPSGVLEPTPLRPFESIGVGPIKILGSTAVSDPQALAQLFQTDPQAALTTVLTNPGLVRLVTADPNRRYLSVAEWITAFLGTGPMPGPVGHGFSADMLDTGRLDFTFPVAPGVLGIGLDTVNHGGYADGSVGSEQLAWLEARLAEVHSRYYDAAGVEVRTGHTDHVVVLFSHHNLYTLDNVLPDLRFPLEARLGFDALRALLARFPNVIAWVNGHSHVNRITPVPDASGRTGGFWEISTAAHVDYPEHARVVEIVDNCDGTLSIFCVLLEHAAPPGTSPDDYSTLGLAAISRELAANDPQLDSAAHLGAPTDLNVELLIRSPFDASGVCGRVAAAATGSRGGPELVGAGAGGVSSARVLGSTTTRLAATGWGSGAALTAGGALLGGALALRRRVAAGSPESGVPQTDATVG
ncbi:MAG: TIGR03767 family metallophosphoesterase [Acidimicrobiales bacterium]